MLIAAGPGAAAGRTDVAVRSLSDIAVAVRHLAWRQRDRRRCRSATAGATQRCDGAGLTDGWMPFHKLSQWLTYSLLEPFEWAGVHGDGLDALTGLPEYRNGGLLLDTGVLRLRDPDWARAHLGGRATRWWSSGAR